MPRRSPYGTDPLARQIPKPGTITTTWPPDYTVTSNLPNNSTQSGTVTWIATPNLATNSVDFKVDGSTVGTDSSSPFQFSLDTTLLADGVHTLALVAHGSDGRTANFSETVTYANGGPAVLHKGIATGFSILNESDATMNLTLDFAADLGAQWIRTDCLNSAQFQTQIGKVIDGSIARGMKNILTLYGTPGGNGNPDANTMQTFAQAQAIKWAPKGVTHFEVLNEPDGPRNPAWTPSVYTGVMKAAYNGMKAGNPNSVCIGGGGLYVDAANFVQGMYNNGAHGFFDILSLHLYGYPGISNAQVFVNAFTGNPNVRSIMNANGDSAIPIISTESGEGVAPHSNLTETQQATICTDILGDNRLDICCIYTIRNGEVPGFGLLRDDLSHRPAYAAVKAAS